MWSRVQGHWPRARPLELSGAVMNHFSELRNIIIMKTYIVGLYTEVTYNFQKFIGPHFNNIPPLEQQVKIL